MNAAIDHVFVCCSVGGPEADALRGLGLKEGSPNTHPGQGTACRRFFFSNAYLELFWVHDPALAQSPAVARTRLWERWSQRDGAACPYAIVLRPGENAVPSPPFPTWPYRPEYMPDGVSIDIALDTPLSGPEFFYLGFQKGRPRAGVEPVDHDLPLRTLRQVTVWRPAGGHSAAAAILEGAGLVSFRDADRYLMELSFNEGGSGRADCRPGLPLVLKW